MRGGGRRLRGIAGRRRCVVRADLLFDVARPGMLWHRGVPVGLYVEPTCLSLPPLPPLPPDLVRVLSSAPLRQPGPSFSAPFFHRLVRLFPSTR